MTFGIIQLQGLFKVNCLCKVILDLTDHKDLLIELMQLKKRKTLKVSYACAINLLVIAYSPLSLSYFIDISVLNENPFSLL